MSLSNTSELSGKRIGIVLPSSNTVVEPLAADMLAGTGVTAHFSRLGVINVALDARSKAQFELQRHVDAAKLLADADVDVIVWGGTSASWLGSEHDQAFCKSVFEQTGIPATSCVLEMNRTLLGGGALRFGLVTPYTDDVRKQIIANYHSMGHICCATENYGGTLSCYFAKIDPYTVALMVRSVAVSLPDVVFIMCTNVRGAAIATPLSEELGFPVIDSAAMTITAGLEMLQRT